jgi:predicted RNase H-like HicB family nuclease
MIKFGVRIIVEPDETGFHAYCPALKGLHTCGETKEEAIQNAKDAALAYLLSIIKHGDPIPEGIIVRVQETFPKCVVEQMDLITNELILSCAI